MVSVILYAVTTVSEAHTASNLFVFTHLLKDAKTYIYFKILHFLKGRWAPRHLTYIQNEVIYIRVQDGT